MADPINEPAVEQLRAAGLELLSGIRIDGGHVEHEEWNGRVDTIREELDTLHRTYETHPAPWIGILMQEAYDRALVLYDEQVPGAQVPDPADLAVARARREAAAVLGEGHPGWARLSGEIEAVETAILDQGISAERIEDAIGAFNRAHELRAVIDERLEAIDVVLYESIGELSDELPAIDGAIDELRSVLDLVAV